MLSQSLSEALAARGIHYGWVMVALVLAYGICSSATLGIPGVLMVAMSNELGWSIGDLSGPFGLRMALFGLVAPFAGGLMLIYGLRTVLTVAAMLIIAGLVLAMTMTAKWELWLGLGIIIGIGTGMTSLVLATKIATTWFVARRGLVLGILGAGNATGQLIFLPMAAWLAEHYGWRSALLPSIVMIGMIGTAFTLLSRDRPSELGLAPFGADTITPTPPPRMGSAFTMSIAALRNGSRSTAFWVLAFTFSICGATSFGLTPHFVTLCGDYGIGAISSTKLLALIGICDFIGTIGSGWLSDRYDNRWLLALYFGLRGLSLIWLPYSDFSLIGLSVFAIVYGLDFIATLPPTVRLTAHTFGAEEAPLVFG
jgi:MFS family permease